MKYRIGVVQRVYEETTIEIEADNPEQAEEKASAALNAGNAEWRFLECDNHCPYEFVSIDELA